MTDSSLPGASADAGAPPTIEGLMARLTDPELPDYGRKPLLAQLEALHQQNAGGAAADARQDAETAEAFAPPASAQAYAFEQALPPGVVIADDVALGTLKGSLASAGVPAEIANGAFAHIASLHAEGAFDTPQSEEHAVLNCRDTLDKVHGREAADQIVEDALAWMNDLARQQPSLREALRHARASPMAVMAAANMKRVGAARR